MTQTAYQVIARKWRPQQFADVIGQEHISRTLINAIQQNRIAHAFLFVGPRGTGKTTTARILAKALNCEKGPTPNPCDECPACREIMAGNSMDVLEIDGASNNGVEQVRDLRDNVRYAPVRGKFKIYIIDEVHMLSTAAFNALLKTLEEPPSHVKFVFATTEADKVLPTILSRVQRFDLRRIPNALIVKKLKEICASEKVDIEEAALFAVARGSEGGMRDAQSSLDQLISFCGNTIKESDVLSVFGLVARANLVKLAECILSGDVSQAWLQLQDFVNTGKDLNRVLADVLEIFRSMMLLKITPESRRDLDLPEGEIETLQKLGQKAELDYLIRVVDLLAGAESRLKYALSKQVLLEVTILKAMRSREVMPIDEVIRRLVALKSGGGDGGSSEGGAASGNPVTPPVQRHVEPVRTQASSEKKSSVERREGSGNGGNGDSGLHSRAPESLSPDLQKLWQQLVERSAMVSPMLKSFLSEPWPMRLEEDILTIGIDPEFSFKKDMLSLPKNMDILRTKLHEILNRQVSIRFEVTPDRRLPEEKVILQSSGATAVIDAPKQDAKPARMAAGKPGTPPGMADFKKDPLIQKALEIFRGELISSS